MFVACKYSYLILPSGHPPDFRRYSGNYKENWKKKKVTSSTRRLDWKFYQKKNLVEISGGKVANNRHEKIVLRRACWCNIISYNRVNVKPPGVRINTEQDPKTLSNPNLMEISSNFSSVPGRISFDVGLVISGSIIRVQG